jgi:hypothetical protein
MNTSISSHLPTCKKCGKSGIIFGHQDHFNDCSELTKDHSWESSPEYLDNNPKDAIGSTKVPLGLVPLSFTAVTALGLLEGKSKYGLVNWRAAPVRASIYIDALLRHVGKWVEGEECDPETKVPHLGNAAACIAILVDAQAKGTLIDDRPASNPTAIDNLTESQTVVQHLQKLFADKHPKHYTRGEAKNEKVNRIAGNHV